MTNHTAAVAAAMTYKAKAGADLAAAHEELRQAQAREARLREALEVANRHIDPAESSRARADYVQVMSALEDSGDNPVMEVVDAARQWGNALNNKYDSRDAQGKLYDALARLDGSAEEKG